MAIDDEIDPFRDLVQEPAKLPDGVHFETEVVSVGEVSSKERRYARISPTRGESVDAALVRSRSFFAGVRLPAGESISFQRLSEFDEDQGRVRDTGYRTFILAGAPVITENVVHAATARAPEDWMDAWTVNIDLTPSGSERFRKFTADHIGRRMAIVENGMVMSATVIRSEIAGGRASITIGGGTDGAEEARALAMALEPH